jgi:hypothetical protein
MVRLERHIVFPVVFRLIELALLLLVASTTAGRAFSAMKIIKTMLHNKMSDGWLNDLMVCYIEKDILAYSKDFILKKFKRHFKRRKIDKCNCLILLGVTRYIS